MSWKQARLLDQGITSDMEQRSFDEFVEAEGTKLAARLRKHFGVQLDRNPAVWAYALELCNQSLPRQLAEVWEIGIDGEEEDVEDYIQSLPDGLIDPDF